MSFRIVLISHYPLLEYALLTFLSRLEPTFEVVAHATNVLTGERFVHHHKPDLVLVEHTLFQAAPSRFKRIVRQHKQHSRTAVLFNYPHEINPPTLLAAQVAGAIWLREPLETWLRGLRALAGGDIWFSQIVTPTPQDNPPPTLLDPLTEVERTVLSLVVDEHTNEQIAGRLNVSTRTVQNYLSAVYRKLDVQSRVGAAVAAVRHGLVSENAG